MYIAVFLEIVYSIYLAYTDVVLPNLRPSWLIDMYSHVLRLIIIQWPSAMTSERMTNASDGEAAAS